MPLPRSYDDPLDPDDIDLAYTLVRLGFALEPLPAQRVIEALYRARDLAAGLAEAE